MYMDVAITVQYGVICSTGLVVESILLKLLCPSYRTACCFMFLYADNIIYNMCFGSLSDSGLCANHLLVTTTM